MNMWRTLGILLLSTAAFAQDHLSSEEVQRAMVGEGMKQHIEFGTLTTAYTAEALIAIKAASARKTFSTYVPTAEDTMRGLTVDVDGATGRSCIQIERVALVSDKSGNVVEEAKVSYPTEVSGFVTSALSANCFGRRAKFTQEQVNRVQQAAHNGEFLIVVFSGTFALDSKVGQKQLAKLGLR